MKVFTANQAVQEPCKLLQPLRSIPGHGEPGALGAVDPVLRFQQRATCDEQEATSVRDGAAPQSLRDVGANRSGRSDELDADRPLIDLRPCTSAVADIIRERRREAVGEEISMPARCHTEKNLGAAQPAPPPATSYVLPADA
jgi:hypothetical protein